MNLFFSFIFYIQKFYNNIFSERFDEMVRWMDHVDDTLRIMLQEVSSLEEFEQEKSVFQVKIKFYTYFHSYLLNLKTDCLLLARIASTFKGKYTT